MKSVVAGMAGAARIRQLTMAGLSRAEKHGKRLDETGKARALSAEPPVTTTGLDLNHLFQEHVKGAFIPKAKSKAMHVLVQFPTELVDPRDAGRMLHHARRFAMQVFGSASIFADRVDRDEKSQYVVDLFVVPKYVKSTKHQDKVAVSMTRHLKALAEAHGHPPTPHGIGRALQQALFEYLRDDMGLKDVKRGTAKEFAGPDHKSAEQLRMEELEDLEAAAARSRDEGWKAGYQRGLDEAKHEAERRRTRQDERDRQLASREASQLAREKALDGVRSAIHADRTAAAEARAAVEADRRAAAMQREQANALGLAEAKSAIKMLHEAAARDRSVAAAERASAKAQAVVDAQEALLAEKASLAAQEAQVRTLDSRARNEIARASALAAGIQAWASGDITRVAESESGQAQIWFRDRAAQQRVEPQIQPAWRQVWETILALSVRVSERATEIENAAKRRARDLVDAATEAVQAFLACYNSAGGPERHRLSQTRQFEAVTALVNNPAVRTAHAGVSQGDNDSDFLAQAIAAGLVKGVKLPTSGAGRNA